jgi:hypothetical protein
MLSPLHHDRLLPRRLNYIRLLRNCSALVEMLCKLCSSIDFSSSDLQSESDLQPDLWDGIQDEFKPSDCKGDHHISSHHSSLEALHSSAQEGCYFCVTIRSELLHIRGHELNEEQHRGSLEVRYYPHSERVDRNGVRSREIFVVARTPIRDVKLTFDFTQYEGEYIVLTSLIKPSRKLLTTRRTIDLACGR